ncbi:iojap-like protein [Deinococcus proteolyticus MRP]|uniref:Ribosomal silencing factor RsfS n=1 Tax=Deinococcus proteolyticus (strain ATCC 35074 / DSM 20540 / JCM 6276 / NBRC 101906 / NCIMB 13154 / VKM Ac-1939 / CCM 2703 / MRP) TaxID=693977 RepID=F0RNS2_DEIPM|nr:MULTISPECIES: ribosome silencing factor [Deinococcus]ADY25305.1 iojap-like protein [Deinococcus proteolyticus MRP]MCY1703406.1 ribosome silencing factor [Deinococcus sp. SL84]
MTKQKTQDLRQLQALVEAARERRAENVRVLDLTDVSTSLDYFIICTATAGLQLNAVQQSIRERAEEVGLPAPSVEGPSERWLLLSFGAITVHIMTKEAREYYDLEGLWSDAEDIDFPEVVPG